MCITNLLIFITWTETLHILELCQALIGFIGSIKVREIQVTVIKVKNFRVMANRVRARARPIVFGRGLQEDQNLSVSSYLLI